MGPAGTAPDGGGDVTRTDEVIVAPRELTDYLWRAARLVGADAGTAARFARHLTEAHVDLGNSIGIALEALDSTPPLHRYHEAVAALEQAEVALRHTSSHRMVFDEPMPLGLLWGQGLEGRIRGVRRPVRPRQEVATDRLSEIELVQREPGAAPYRQWAYRDGVAVPAAEFDALVERAKPILVSEQVLDRADAVSS